MVEITQRVEPPAAEFYMLRIGEFELIALGDGGWDYPLANFFPDVPREQLQAALGQYNLTVECVTTPYTYLCVNTGHHAVLVDMGAGPGFAPRAGKLLHSMQAAGIAPGQIDTIVITHAHPDHIGGTLDEAGKPIYAKAGYAISKNEWDFWFSEISMAVAPESFVTVARRNLEPIRNRVTLVEGESEIVPGIRAIPAPGHTPGHLVVEVSSGGKLLLYIGDTVLHPLHLEHPEWFSIYDLQPEAAGVSRRRIFDLAATEKALVMGQHFSPFPSLGTVVKNGKGWKWQPLEMGGTI